MGHEEASDWLSCRLRFVVSHSSRKGRGLNGARRGVGLDGDFVFDAAAILDFGHGLVGFE
jgi:hypothetical protein